MRPEGTLSHIRILSEYITVNIITHLSEVIVFLLCSLLLLEGSLLFGLCVCVEGDLGYHVRQ